MTQRAFELPVLHEPRRADGAVDHAAAAARFTADEARTDWHDGALWWVREKRDRAASSIGEWETLRELASGIKEHTLSRLDEHLARFEAQAVANGATVHWARDADEHNRIVHGILAAAGATRLVKSKSMLTEECGLNPYLTARGIEVVDTDLGERIVQLRGEAPSHIVMPAIHLKKGEIGDTFHEHLGTPAGLDDPVALTAAARTHLRGKFLAADAALTGANFAVAETGGLVVCTNEGNADLGMALAPVYIASLGIEKLIPRAADLGVFLRLLTRSATGQPVTVYTSHVHGPRAGQALHVVLVDNGRSRQLGRADFWRSLKCIRCGACMNTCPVYRRSGGHSYGSTVPGPIGAVLTPGLDLEKYASLPFASTLCGSCTAVCPVKIDLDAQLYRWRQVVVAAGHAPAGKQVAMWGAGQLLGRPWLLRLAGAAARLGLRTLPARVTRAAAGVWGRTRDLPEPPVQSFRAWYRANRPNAVRPLVGVQPMSDVDPGLRRDDERMMGTSMVDVDPGLRRDDVQGKVRHSGPARHPGEGRDPRLASNHLMSARDAILAAVRAARPAVMEAPDVPAAVRAFTVPAGDLTSRFAESARGAGALVVEAARSELARLVGESHGDATRVLSMVAGVPGAVRPPNDPHALADLDLFVCEGTLGVAENGAVWLPASRLGQRAALFLATAVVVVLERSAIVADLHAAYERLDVAAEPFGLFLAGPSKTADIEQSLVVGAHGAKRLTVVLVNG